MKDRPAYLPLYVRDFLTDPKVLAMPWLEQAIYLRMLMLSWEAGPLPDAPGKIERMIGLGADQRVDSCAASIEDVLRECWKHEKRGWTNPRLEFERSRWAEMGAARSEKARNAANKRWTDARSNALAVLGDANPQAQAQEKKEEEKSQNGAAAPIAPDGASPPRAKKPPRTKRPEWTGTVPVPLLPIASTWDTWLRFRREDLRKPVTQISGDQALRELAGLGADRARVAIEHTIARGWQGIREPELPRNGHHPQAAAKPSNRCALCSRVGLSMVNRQSVGPVCLDCANGL